MKKAFTLLVVLIIVSAFSLLLLFSIEVKTLKNNNQTKAYLYLQAKLHMQFLEDVAKNLSDDTIETLFLQKENFSFEIHNLEKRTELFVYSNKQDIRLHKSLTK